MYSGLSLSSTEVELEYYKMKIAYAFLHINFCCLLLSISSDYVSNKSYYFDSRNFSTINRMNLKTQCVLYTDSSKYDMELSENLEACKSEFKTSFNADSELTCVCAPGFI